MMVIIKKSILFLIFSLTLNSFVYANNGCIVNGLDIKKADKGWITIGIKDNSNCSVYKFVKTGYGLYSLTASDMNVKLGDIVIDAYSSSKITSIIPREKEIYFKLNFDPSVVYKLIDGVRYISFMPPKDLIIFDNNPINMIEKLECKRSIGIIDITTSSPISFDYGKIKDNLQYVDIENAYISDKTEIIGSCKDDMTYSYIPHPLRIRFLISNLNYTNSIAYLLEYNMLTFSQIIERNIVYVTKISQEIFDNKTVLNIGLSSGDITSIIKKSDKEFVIELNENTSSIGNLTYPRKFTTGIVRSIGRQSIGKKDRFIVRIDTGNTLNIINNDNGFTIETFKGNTVEDNISIIDNKTKKGVKVEENTSTKDNKTIKNIQNRDNSSATDKKAIIEQSEKDG